MLTEILMLVNTNKLKKIYKNVSKYCTPDYGWWCKIMAEIYGSDCSTLIIIHHLGLVQ
jgi:hypothetical protein